VVKTLERPGTQGDSLHLHFSAHTQALLTKSTTSPCCPPHTQTSRATTLFPARSGRRATTPPHQAAPRCSSTSTSSTSTRCVDRQDKARLCVREKEGGGKQRVEGCVGKCA
jgi:hypothetical protein